MISAIEEEADRKFAEKEAKKASRQQQREQARGQQHNTGEGGPRELKRKRAEGNDEEIKSEPGHSGAQRNPKRPRKE